MEECLDGVTLTAFPHRKFRSSSLVCPELNILQYQGNYVATCTFPQCGVLGCAVLGCAVLVCTVSLIV